MLHGWSAIQQGRRKKGEGRWQANVIFTTSHDRNSAKP